MMQGFNLCRKLIPYVILSRLNSISDGILNFLCLSNHLRLGRLQLLIHNFIQFRRLIFDFGFQSKSTIGLLIYANNFLLKSGNLFRYAFLSFFNYDFDSGHTQLCILNVLLLNLQASQFRFELRDICLRFAQLFLELFLQGLDGQLIVCKTFVDHWLVVFKI